MGLQDVKNHGLLIIKQHTTVLVISCSFFSPVHVSLLCLHFRPEHQDVQVTTLCIAAYNFTGEHSTTPVNLHCTFPEFSCAQAYIEKNPFDGTSFKIFLGSETRREETCQGSSTELLALLAPPITQPSSLPPLLEKFLHPP